MNSKNRLVWAAVFIALAALVCGFLLGGFIVYQWMLATEAMLASLVLLGLHVRYHRNDPRESKWPPLLPLAVIAAAGGAKSYYVAVDADTPRILVASLFGAVSWFFVSSWRIWRGEHK